jgi:hypothetical protein
MPVRYKSDEKVLTLAALLCSLAAFWYFFTRAEVLLYGDAVAHINIARRVLDSRTPGPLQLGTVWLPLPHILMLPLVWWDAAWQTGLAGSIPSMFAYVIAVRGIFRLTAVFSSRTAAWIAAVAFALNPNLLYLQSTAMTETIYLAAMIWACAYFVHFWIAVRHQQWDIAEAALPKTAIALIAAALTRYDGWFLAGCIGAGILLRLTTVERSRLEAFRRPLLRFAALTLAVPVLWLAYNAAVYGDPLEFARGQYSAKAIAERTTKAGDPPHPGAHHLRTATTYFLRSARLNIGESRLQPTLFWCAVLASLIAIVDRRFRPALVLWVPLPFYALSVAYGGVPIFIPEWWPFSYYNVRYGIQLLPAIAIFLAVSFEILRRVNWSSLYVRLLPAAAVALISGAYLGAARVTPIALREAKTNSLTDIAHERALAAELSQLPPDSSVLIFTGTHSRAIQTAGIHYQRLVYEGNFRLWPEALAHPSTAAAYVVATEGDAVANAVSRNSTAFQTLAVIRTVGKPRTVIYKSIGNPVR